VRLWTDTRFQPLDRFSPAFAMARQRRNGPILEAMERDLDAVLGSMDTSLGTWGLPPLLAGCDQRSAERVRALVEPRLARRPGLASGLQQAEEQTRLCTARRQAVGGEAAEFFRGLVPEKAAAAAR